jgi:CDGSH-type Zn-finger protein
MNIAAACPGCLVEHIRLEVAIMNIKRQQFEREDRMAQVKITVKRNSAYRVEAPPGVVELVDADGNPYDISGKAVFSLCRCGASVTKPFCDGTHTRIGFQAAEVAVKPEK